MNSRNPVVHDPIPLSLSELARCFADPPKGFSPVPIWWWSGDRLERARLRWQMERMAEGGVYNLIVLNLAPTGPLYGADPDDPPFLSEEWWTVFEQVCEDARDIGVYLWFYDQLGFSGANLQGGLVRQEPEFAGQWLACATAEGDGALEVRCPAGGEPLAAFVVPIDERGRPTGEPTLLSLGEPQARVQGPGWHRVRLIYAVRRGFDYFNPRACVRLREIVHGAFARRVGRFFGDVIVGSFQDELPSMPTWGASFAAEFQRRRGYDLRTRLIALWEGEDEEAARVRVDYHRTRAELAEEAFFRPLFEWHERHGLICGFDQQGPARAGYPIAAVQTYADYLRTHRWYGAPGSDHHGEAKIHSSLAHLYGRPRIWIEAFHSSGWGGTLEETFDWLLPWLRAGANLYDPHAVYYSTRGGWWEWAPPSTCWRQPYWRHYSLFAGAVSRLCYLLSRGHHVCDVAVLYPTTTVQSGLTIEEALSDAQAAEEVYLALVGRMFWQHPVPGVLDRDRRDFDVIDEDSLRRAEVRAGQLCIGQERYRVVVLPACTALAEATAAVLDRFVQEGGRLVAVGALPRWGLSAEGRIMPGAVAALRQRFERGEAIHIAAPEELPQALADLPRPVEAPVPTLRRRIDGREVLFVPAAYPHATRHEESHNWLQPRYTFDPGRYARRMKLIVRGVKGAPQLWDPTSGRRRRLPARVGDDVVEVEVPFDSGPAAVLLWPGEDDPEEADLPAKRLDRVEETLLELGEVWESQLEPTLDNRFGDLAKPDHPGAPPPQTWRFQHRVEEADGQGMREGWQRPDAGGSWEQVHATFGTYGWWLGPRAVDALPEPLAEPGADDDPLGVADWQPTVYSLTRGILKDPIHRGTLGPKGHVPEEFLHFGPVYKGQGVQFRTAVWLPEAQELYLALAAPAAKQAWVNGQALGEGPPGYLWLAPVRLRAGMNLLEWRLWPERDLILRSYWALVRSPERFRRPEWMTSDDRPQRDTVLRFWAEVEVPFEPAEATVQVGASAPCRLLVNGEEVGRQGGFDPYGSMARVQPYRTAAFQRGTNRIELEVQDMGRPVALMVDALVRGGSGEELVVTSGPHWRVRRGDGDARPVTLRRRQWVDRAIDAASHLFVDLDPAWAHLWRRPHPLPGAMWIEDREADDTVVLVVPDALGERVRAEWFRWRVPPGATTMRLPVAGRARVWVNGQVVPAEGERVPLPEPQALRRMVVMRVVPARGRTGGGVFEGPVTYEVGTGRIALGEWAGQGLAAYAGGVRYGTMFTLDARPEGVVELDLGRVRGTAEVWLNGQVIGARVWSPYRFDVTEGLRAGENRLEVVVFNTLAPYLDAVSPTHYVFPGQEVSGLFGSVRLVRIT